MRATRSFTGPIDRHRVRIVPVLLLLVAWIAVAAPEARATLMVINHNDPAGDPTVINYRVDRADPPWTSDPFPLHGGGDYRSFGQGAGTYVIQALVPAGWQVGDIKCVSNVSPNAFAYDVANGRVTVTHGEGNEDFCTFTNRKLAGGSGQSPGAGVAPSPPPSLVPASALPREPALLGIRPGRRYAEATIRITRRSVIKGRLLRRGVRVVGSKRIEREAGTHVLKVKVKQKKARRWKRRGLRRVTLTLRIAVTERGGGTHVFRHRVLVNL